MLSIPHQSLAVRSHQHRDRVRLRGSGLLGVGLPKSWQNKSPTWRFLVIYSHGNTTEYLDELPHKHRKACWRNTMTCHETQFPLRNTLGRPCAKLARCRFQTTQSSPQTRLLNFKRKVLERLPYNIYIYRYTRIYEIMVWLMVLPVSTFPAFQAMTNEKKPPCPARWPPAWQRSVWVKSLPGEQQNSCNVGPPSYKLVYKPQ